MAALRLVKREFDYESWFFEGMDLMQLDPLVRDYASHLEGLVRLLQNTSTRVYLDTSLLMWLIGIGIDARREFFDWCDGRAAGSVRIPVWAAHELHRHTMLQTIQKSAQSMVGEAKRKYEEFAGMAAERADDQTCRARGYTGRSSYVGELARSAVMLEQLSLVLKPDDASLRASTEEIIQFVNARVLTSDLTPIIASLSQIGDFRIRHRIPPAFEDRKKDENVFGDAIIWEEIIADAQITIEEGSAPATDAVFVTLDRKRDWVSSAPQIINEFGYTQSPAPDASLDVSLPHPMLVHEYRHRGRGGQLLIATPAFLAAALHREARNREATSEVQHWLAASHRPAPLNNLMNSIESAAMRRAAAVTAPDIRPIPQASAGLVEAPDDLDLAVQTPSRLMSIDIHAPTRQLMDALPDEQKAILEGLIDRLLNGSLSPYALGQILSAISINGLVNWPDSIPPLLEQLAPAAPQTVRHAVLLSILASIYFDRYGELLPQPNQNLASVCLPLERETVYTPAFVHLNRLLRGAGAHLPYIPGGESLKVQFTIDAIPGKPMRLLRDVRIGKQPVLIDSLPTDSVRRLSVLFERAPSIGCDGKELRSLLAGEFLIPMNALSGATDSQRFTWSPDCGLAILDTGVEGGISALATRGDEDE
jgi:hypothetical protein